jgi:hypothetical protein
MMLCQMMPRNLAVLNISAAFNAALHQSMSLCTEKPVVLVVHFQIPEFRKIKLQEMPRYKLRAIWVRMRIKLDRLTLYSWENWQNLYTMATICTIHIQILRFQGILGMYISDIYLYCRYSLG